jgi:hypothetical protein
MSEDQLRKQEDDLKAARKDEQRNIEILLTIGVPILFGVYGLLRWRRRTAARENVSLA